MYSLKFIHPKGTSTVIWELDVPNEDAVFIDCTGEMAKGFTLKANPKFLTIYHGVVCLLELWFLDERMIYILRLHDERGKTVIREFYLEEDDLTEEKRFAVKYP